MESALTMVPPNSWARRMASADLPLAVGPAMRMARNIQPAMPLKRRTFGPRVKMPDPTASVPAASHVATLVSNPARPALTDALLTRAAQVLPHVTGPVWLDKGIAADLPFTPHADGDPCALADRVRQVLDGAPVDVVIQIAHGRRKRLFLA